MKYFPWIMALLLGLPAISARADSPKVTLGGYADFQAGWTDGSPSSVPPIAQSVAFRNDDEVDIRIDGKTEGGLGYGARVELEADRSDDIHGAGLNAARTFTYLENGWGRLELGGNVSPAATMRVDASTLAVATGGINGDWGDQTGVAFGTAIFAEGPFITGSKLQTEHGFTILLHDEGTEAITRITYYSPSWAGLQFGAGFAPNLDAKGQDAYRAHDDFDRIVDLAVSHHADLGRGIALASAVTYEHAHNNAGFGGDNLEGWNAGALLDIRGVKLAGSYGDWIHGTLESVLIPDTHGAYWTAGAGTDIGPLGLSATYLQSRLDLLGENRFHNLVLSADYKLAPGLMPYVEAAFYRFESPSFSLDGNDGTTILAGTHIAF